LYETVQLYIFYGWHEARFVCSREQVYTAAAAQAAYTTLW